MFLSVLNNDRDRHPVLRTILDEVRASRGSLRLVTSTFTLTEVAYITQEKESRVLDDTSLRMIDGLLGDETLVELVEATRFVMTVHVISSENLWYGIVDVDPEMPCISQQHSLRMLEVPYLQSARFCTDERHDVT